MIQRSSYFVILLSFLILFLELSLIRFLPAKIGYLGYFTNFILISSFFGIGIGFLLSGLKINLIKFFPILFLCLILITKLFGSNINISSDQIIFFSDEVLTSLIKLPPFILLPILFCAISLLFACLAQSLGRFFKQRAKPNGTYIFDILGSILGIVLFSICAYLSLPPSVWFLIVAASFLLLLPKNPKVLILSIICLGTTIASTVNIGAKNIFWSPYYQISLFLNSDSSWGQLYANNIIHQNFSILKISPSYYSLVYSRFFSKKAPDDVLIIGSGSGQDVVAALSAGVKHIDAVEIDPKILEIGKKYHPESPYSDSRVNIVNNDGRNYLKNTDKKYDLIIFALTDSLIVNSTGANIRLESYLFTKESFQEVQAHLKKDGAFVLYNDYRQQWLIDRIGNMLQATFGYPPQVGRGSSVGSLFFIKKILDQPANKYPSDLPEDNWPFLYLKTHSIPSIYLSTLSVILLIAVVTILIIFNKVLPKTGIDLKRLTVFFLLGAAFSLLETKSIVQLNLVFGTTWFVNSIAFAGILLAVLAAALATLKWQIKKPLILILLLLFSLTLQCFIPLSALMVNSLLLKFLITAVYFYLPIFFANLIFTNIFAKSQSPQLDFGANLLGLVFGGIAEYIVLISGYSSLTILVALFYLLALGIKFITRF